MISPVLIPNTMLPQSNIANMEVGFRTGTGKPAVPDKRVPQVRVRYPIWHTRAIPCTRMAVSRVRTGILGSEQTAFFLLRQWFSDSEIFCLAP
jgi:hypothetical protein